MAKVTMHVIIFHRIILCLARRLSLSLCEFEEVSCHIVSYYMERVMWKS